MKQVTLQEGLFELARAVCRQWVYDGKPEHCRKQVMTYAEIMQVMKRQHTKQWYRQARALLKTEDLQIEDEEAIYGAVLDSEEGKA